MASKDVEPEFSRQEAEISNTAILDAFRAIRSVPPRDGKAWRIYVAGCSGEPSTLFDDLKGAPELATNVRFGGIWIPGVNTCDWAALSTTTEADTIFLSPELRSSFAAMRTHFHPLTYTQAVSWLPRTMADAAFVMTTPPDENGNVSLGISADFSGLALQFRPRHVIALINPRMPRPADAPTYPLSDFDLAIEIDQPLTELLPTRLDDRFAAIGRHIANLIPDGAALQFGLGKVQAAVLAALSGHHDLRIHSGMISDPVADLIDASAVTGITTGVALGTPGFYDRAAREHMIAWRPVAHTHGISTLTALKGPFFAINSVIEVDLFGQANAEFIGSQQISGGGGLADFLAGAVAHPQGTGIIALLSNARGGSLSRIVPRLSAPAITLSRQQVSTVITEHGVAHLSGLDIDARAQNIISIADPAHRDALSKEWDAMRSAM